MSPVAQSSDALSKTRSRPDCMMFPTISETRFNGSSNGSSAFHFNNFHLTGHRSLSEEEQHLYNHHIIENFVESVREMNDVVLIPSKLKDLDSTQSAVTTVSPSKYVVLNDDLYSYYQMINVVKNDLFEPHNHEARSSMYFSMPKRKISRREQKSNGHSRNVSASNLNALLTNGNSFSNGNNSAAQSNGYSNGQTDNAGIVPLAAISNGDSSNSSTCSSNGTASAAAVNNGPQSPTALVPLTSDQLIGQNSKQLTVQFIHHLHSLYTILEHFTSAADFITERYQTEVESAI